MALGLTEGLGLIGFEVIRFRSLEFSVFCRLLGEAFRAKAAQQACKHWHVSVVSVLSRTSASPIGATCSPEILNPATACLFSKQRTLSSTEVQLGFRALRVQREQNLESSPSEMNFPGDLADPDGEHDSTLRREGDMMVEELHPARMRALLSTKILQGDLVRLKVSYTRWVGCALSRMSPDAEGSCELQKGHAF